MVLKTKVKLFQSKKAWTQYMTIPSAVVQDSQYPFEADIDLYLQIEPKTGIMIISKEQKPIEVTKIDLRIKVNVKDTKADAKLEQPTQLKNG